MGMARGLRALALACLALGPGGCSWNMKSRAPAPRASSGSAAQGAPYATYRLAGDLPRQHQDFVAGKLRDAGFLPETQNGGRAGPLHLELDLRWSMGSPTGKGLRIAACLATLTLLPCWGKVTLEVDATARDQEAARRYSFRHGYRRAFWLLLLNVASRESQPTLVHLGAPETRAQEDVLAESLEHLLALMSPQEKISAEGSRRSITRGQLIPSIISALFSENRGRHRRREGIIPVACAGTRRPRGGRKT